MRIQPARRLRGTVQLPGDKSISHRYAILGGIARGETAIGGYSASLDCASTLRCLEALGVEVRRDGSRVFFRGTGLQGLRPPDAPLDAGNSGTSLRLLAGVLASLPFPTRIGGDASLNRRPMQRIIEPLERMGARLRAAPGGLPPLEIEGGRLQGIDYTLPVASAQVKSCVLLAGVHASGTTAVRERAASRDHTERALPQFGVRLERRQLVTTVEGGQEMRGTDLQVPGDFSAAAFLLAAALLVPDSRLVLPDVGLNPTRTGLLQLLDPRHQSIRAMAPVEWNGEPVATLAVRHDTAVFERLPAELGGTWIPNLIDEIPILAVLGTRLPRGLRVRDAGELRKKESDRIEAVATNLRSLGVEVQESEDGFFIPPGQQIRGGRVATRGDHRIAMAFTVAGLISEEGVELDDPDCSAVSFPGFFEQIERLRA